MKTEYLLVQWPESQYFIGVKGCYFISLNEDDDLELDQAMFVPEQLYYTPQDHINKQYADLRDMLYSQLFTALQGTSEENPMECNIILESPEDCGLSSLLLPCITEIWMTPDEDFMFKFEGGRKQGFCFMSTDDLMQIVEDLEYENCDTRTSH